MALVYNKKRKRDCDINEFIDLLGVHAKRYIGEVKNNNLSVAIKSLERDLNEMKEVEKDYIFQIPDVVFEEKDDDSSTVNSLLVLWDCIQTTTLINVGIGEFEELFIEIDLLFEDEAFSKAIDGDIWGDFTNEVMALKDDPESFSFIPMIIGGRDHLRYKSMLANLIDVLRE